MNKEVDGGGIERRSPKMQHLLYLFRVTIISSSLSVLSLLFLLADLSTASPRKNLVLAARQVCAPPQKKDFFISP